MTAGEVASCSGLSAVREAQARQRAASSNSRRRDSLKS